MLVLCSWLNEYLDKKVDIRDDKEVKNLVNILDNLGLVVESVQEVGDDLKGVVLAQVEEINPIEKKDKIRQVFVNAGKSMERIEVVCGAWNFTVGDIVPLATVGTRLPGNFLIEERRLGGVTSNGMLCSKRELGLGEDHSGIDVVFTSLNGQIPADMQLGMSYGEYFGIAKDILLDVAVEPNRPDALCIYGIARDIAPHLGAKLLPLHFDAAPEADRKGQPVSVAIEDDALCDHFSFQVIDNITIAPSTRKIAYRLSLVGMRPINSVVDATNYAMLELGRPSHAYDMDYLSGGDRNQGNDQGVNAQDEVRLVVRLAQEGESLVTLDGNLRSFAGIAEQDPRDLVIAKGDGEILALAGVMGGKASEVTETTSTVVLEIADFDPKVVLRTSRFHQLRSEASLRFERGIDPAITVLVANRIYTLLKESALQYGVSMPRPFAMETVGQNGNQARKSLVISLQNIATILGKTFSRDEIASLLSPVGFEVSQPLDEDKSEVVIPAFRPDVRMGADLAEEIARHFGYENFAKRLPRSRVVGRLKPYQENLRLAKQALIAMGINEAWTNPLVDKNYYPLPKEQLIMLANPLTSEENSLRTSILPGLLGAVKRNASYRNPYLRLFEIGRVFAKSSVKAGSLSAKDKKLRVQDYVSEREELCCVLAFPDDDAKESYKVFEVLLDRLKIDDLSFRLLDLKDLPQEKDFNFMHPSRSKAITLPNLNTMGETLVGTVGEIAPDFLSQFALLGRRVGVLTLDLNGLFSLQKKSLDSKPISIYPSSDIDLCFVADYLVSSRDIRQVLQVAAGEYLESIRLIDSYREENAKVRSLTFRLRLSDANGTLDEKLLGQIWQDCVTSVADSLGVGLRTA
ncbi:MAG: phenylalanine--tRNA ligase subunit beta [Firmicutes bacterium]|jgi:phenylalanyl-tRNA synthetase beta chain|nr:phenylalanine--tRNA ligase subunit beta [Bacillota bacterium]